MLSREEIQRDILDWCQYHYKDNLAALALFDPKPINATFPSGDVNVLLILHSAPAEARDRYDLVAERLVGTIVPDSQVTCRIQTVDEIQSLADLQMPLVSIYLNRAEIFYDPAQVLTEVRRTI